MRVRHDKPVDQRSQKMAIVNDMLLDGGVPVGLLDELHDEAIPVVANIYNQATPLVMELEYVLTFLNLANPLVQSTITVRVERDVPRVDSRQAGFLGGPSSTA